MELLIASSPTDDGISCWDLHSGAEKLCYKSCTSTPHGLTCVGNRFLASSQLGDSAFSSSSSGSIFYWSWNKPQVGVKSFPAEPINPLVSDSSGTYIIGGGLSGDIYIWEVASGRLLKRWNAHYRAVTCLVLSKDESLLISGSADGCVRVWSHLMLFDDVGSKVAKHPYEHSFTEHTVGVTDVVSGYGGGNAIIISSSEDRTCKVWSLSKGKLLRNINFPVIVDAIVLEPGEHVFYAGGRDGKIYIVPLNAESTSRSNYGMHTLVAVSDRSKAVSCLALSADGNLLVSGLKDGTIQIWDTKMHHIIHLLRHSKGPVNNVLVIKQSLLFDPQISVGMDTSNSRKHERLLPPPLDRYMNSSGENDEMTLPAALHVPCHDPLNNFYFSSHAMSNQIKELQRQGSSVASEMELERLRLDCKRSLQMAQHWKKMFEDLHQFCVNEIVDDSQTEGGSNENPS